MALVLLAGCNQMPTSGPSTETVNKTPGENLADASIQLIDIDESTVTQLSERRKRSSFADAFGQQAPLAPVLGSGDMVEVTIWEAPPAALFSGSSLDAHVSNTTSVTTLPTQMVDRDGFIAVPFAGRVHASGQSAHAVASVISERLRGKANQPQVLVKVAQNASATVTVVGEVANNIRMPLTAGGERLLEALAAAGGVRQPVSKVSLQLTRGSALHSMPLDAVIRDPRQNVALRPGDVVTALYQSQSFTAMGATGRQDEVAFEAEGITLAQAFGRVGGLLDNRSDPQGVFIFRFEPKSSLAWPREPVTTTADGRVPVIYRLNLRDPKSFFVMQGFTMNHRDVLFVSNSPAADLQKFLNLVSTVTRQVVYTNNNLN